MNSKVSSVSKDELFYLQDIVHGQMELHPHLRSVIDTPQFQRLRNIKNLGLTYLVFPNASHARFEHCIGTSYLTSKVIASLRKKSTIPNIITEEEELCLIVAGLCHDIGHGPFSHFFEIVVPEFCHEKMSVIMLDDLLEKNVTVRDSFKKYGLTEYHISLIKGMITGECDEILIPTIVVNDVTYSKNFLFEIIANNNHGVDTDKMDYLSRDAVMAGLHCTFDLNRLIEHMHISSLDSNLHITFMKKVFVDCTELFHTRWLFHKKVYRHKSVIALELMLNKALTSCYEFTNVYDPNVFVKMTDNIFYEMLNSTTQKFIIAREILQSVMCRNLYKNCGCFLLDTDHISKHDLDDLKQDLSDYLFRNSEDNYSLAIHMAFIEMGYKKGTSVHPVEHIYFIEKRDGQAFRIKLSEFSNIQPKCCSEKHLLVFYE